MPPREATNPFPDQYLTLDYEGGPLPMMQQHDGGGGIGGLGGVGNTNNNIAQTQTTDPTAVDDADDNFGGGETMLPGDAMAAAAVTAHVGNNGGVSTGDGEQDQEEQQPPSDPLGNEFLPHVPLNFQGAPIGSFRLNDTPAAEAADVHGQQPQQGQRQRQQQQFHPQHGFADQQQQQQQILVSGGATAAAAHHALRRPAPAARNVSVDPLSVDTSGVGDAPPAAAGWGGGEGGAPVTPTQQHRALRGRHHGQAAAALATAGSVSTTSSPHLSNASIPSGFGIAGNSVVPTSGRPALSVTGNGSLRSRSVASVGVYPFSANPTQGGEYADFSGDSYSHHGSGQNPNGLASTSSSHGLHHHQQHGAALPHSTINTAAATGDNTSNSDMPSPLDAMESAPTDNGSSNARAVSLTSINASGSNSHGSNSSNSVDQQSDGDDDDDMNSHGTAPISPGSELAPSSTTSPTNSPLVSALLFPGGVSAAAAAASTAASAPPPSDGDADGRSAHRNLLSVLDQSASLDDDDDDDDDDDNDCNNSNEKGDSNCNGAADIVGGGSQGSLPGLDTTNVSDSTEDDCKMEDSEGDPTTTAAAVTANVGASANASGEVTDEDDASSPAPPPPPATDQVSSLPSDVATPLTGAVGGYGASPSGRSYVSQGSAVSNASSSVRLIRGSHAFDMGSPSQQQPHHHHQQQQSQQSSLQSLLVSPLTPEQAMAQAQAQQMQQQQQQQYAQYSAGFPQGHPATQQQQQQPPPPPASSPIALSFASTTTVSDLKYFAERGMIAPLLTALDTPRLKTLGTRMLADYAKMAARRVAVASNRRILEFVSRTMVESPQIIKGQIGEDGSIDDLSQLGDTGPTWLAREYAVETVRSLTATEESDAYLMGCPGLLQTLSCVARGGPFVAVSGAEEDAVPGQPYETEAVGMASPKARLHACIAIMNLSCGKSNKVDIASIPDVLEAMRDVMLGLNFPPPSATRDNGRIANVAEEARLKATTCIKNLSNADANDGALLTTPGLVEALGVVAEASCSEARGATTCTTNACLALMNLSISKANKHRVFRTPGVMDALMAVISRTAPPEDGSTPTGANPEARVKACSALSNLAIGYDNKIPMFNYPGFVDSILGVIETDNGEARTKACSILWSFAAEMKNQVPVVQRGDILPTLVQVADEDGTTEARFKCVAALTLLAESLANAIPLLESGALAPLMDILHEAGPDPTQWKGQTASWCVGFLMNIAQSDEAVPSLREAGVVELLAPLLTLDHYQSLKAAMAITFVCRYDEGDETYDLLRKTENVIPKIIQLLHNTLSGKGGNGYKYGVFTLRSSVGCISSLASGPDFMKERIATKPVFESLLQVLTDFCVDGGTPGAIVGGGKDDLLSATLAVRALQSLTAHLIPIAGSSSLPKEFVMAGMEKRLLRAFESFETCPNHKIKDETRRLASDARIRVLGSKSLTTNAVAKAAVDASMKHVSIEEVEDDNGSSVGSIAASIASSCCGGLPALPDMNVECWPSGSAQHSTVVEPSQQGMEIIEMDDSSAASSLDGQSAVRTFLLTDERTGRRFAVPSDPTGGRAFNDNRVWCYRRGRFCKPGEIPDPNFHWTDELQAAYMTVLARQESSSSSLGRSSSTNVPTAI